MSDSAHETERHRRESGLEVGGGGHGLGIVGAAAAGGIWGALLARVLGEVWPLWWPADGPFALLGSWIGLPCWIWSSLLMVALALCGAIGASFLLNVRRFGSHGAALVPPVRGREIGQGMILACAWPLALGLVYLVQPSVAPLWGMAILAAGIGGTVWLCMPGAHVPGAGTPRQRENAWPRMTWLWDLVAFAFPLSLYVATLAPSVLPGDSGEFQIAASTLGIPHPTGYPLYLVLGKLFSLLPIRSVAYRLNLFSAVAAAGAVWAVYRAGRALGLWQGASLLGASLLAVSEAFWSQATIAEKYALNAFFVALTLWLGLEWRRARSGGTDRSSARWLSAWALCYGLSLAHHRTMLLLAPAFLWLLWSTDKGLFRWRSGGYKMAVRLLLLFLAPLTLYLLLPLFSALDPPYAYMRVDSIDAFLDLVLARTYQGALFRGGWSALPGRLTEFFRLLGRQFGWIGLLLSAGGWVALLRRARSVAWVLLAGITAQVLFALDYYVPNTFVYYLPAYVWMAVCASAAVDDVLAAIGKLGVRGVAGRGSLPLLAHLALVWILVAGAWPTYLCAVRWPGMDQHRAYSRLPFDYTYGQMAARSVESGALLVSDWMPSTVLGYTQIVEGLMPAAQVNVVDPLEGQWPGPVEGALAAGRAAYLARPLVAAGDRYALASAGPLVRVSDVPNTLAPSMSHPAGPSESAGLDLEGEIRLLGCDVVATMPGVEGDTYVPTDRWVASDPADTEHLADTEHPAVEGGSTLHVTVYWQALRSLAGDYGVTLRWVDKGGHTWLERQNRHPVGGTYPTSRWQEDQVVADYYRLALPAHLPSGEYRLLATIGAPLAASGLRDVDGADQLALAAFHVRKPQRWPGSGMDVVVRELFDGGLLLTGYEAQPSASNPYEMVPGETVSVALQWLICGAFEIRGEGSLLGARPRLLLVSRDGARKPVTPLSGSPEDWQSGALVIDTYPFVVPDDLAYVEVCELGSQEACYRLRLRVAAEPALGANFGNQVRLRGYSYASTSLRPGDTVRLTLDWQAARTMDEAYKVFVHVLGADGLPIAQQDNEPVNGTYPTTRWQRGERVSDPYVIALPADLAPGEYAVEVGMYRISDLSRLPVLDEEQRVVDDKVFLTPLKVE